MPTKAAIELRDLRLHTQIGVYQSGDVVPDSHLLDLTLWIDPALVMIANDGMNYVFDYDPLVADIENLAGDGLYETQERLITRIAEACTCYSQITALEISLRKSPVLHNSGSLGVRLSLDQDDLANMRSELVSNPLTKNTV